MELDAILCWTFAFLMLLVIIIQISCYGVNISHDTATLTSTILQGQKRISNEMKPLLKQDQSETSFSSPSPSAPLPDTMLQQSVHVLEAKVAKLEAANELMIKKISKVQADLYKDTKLNITK